MRLRCPILSALKRLNLAFRQKGKGLGCNIYNYVLDRRRPQRRRRHRLPPMSRTSSFSSITDSTMSLNIITVSLNMDTVNFLGISIVGQSNKGGDGGIYVGSIMKGYVFHCIDTL